MFRPLATLCACLCSIASLSTSAQVVGVGGIARDFTLKHRFTKQPISLYDYAGNIVVLDLFAYW
jgi:hypothetical protein